MKIETAKIDDLKLDASNAREHNRRNLDAIKASLEKFGQQKPIVVDGEGVVRAGNGTLIAARELGWKTIHIVRTTLNDAEAAAFAITDNRSNELSEWNLERLKVAIGEIGDASFVTAIGFSPDDLKAIDFLTSDLIEIGDPPESVRQNVDELNAIRRKGNEGVVEKNDTEHYLVVVFPSRAERERAVSGLGLPTDERYVLSASVEIKPRFRRAEEVSASREKSAAVARRAGAAG